MSFAIRKYFFAALMLLVFSPTVLLAQPLSQLDFDRVSKSARTEGGSTADKIKALHAKENLSPEEQEVLKDLQLLIGDEEPVKPAGDGAAVTVTSLEIKKQTVTLEGEDAYIPPQLSGPKSDKNDQGLITSEVSWVPQSRSCIAFVSKEELCSKSQGLREVIGRFTGDDNFFAGVCPVDACSGNERSVVTEVVLTPESQVQLRDIADGKSCRVAMNLVGPRWLLIRAKSIECSCLPKECGA